MPVVTIDGPAGSGKSTVAHLVADAMGSKTVDSGALYRGLAYFFLQRFGAGFESAKTQAGFKQQLVDGVKLNLQWLKNQQQVWLDGKDISQVIRNKEVTAATQQIANNAECREWVNQRLRILAAESAIVADGRDMGSQVFTNAELKIYLFADLQCRVSRRAKELNITASAEYAQLKQSIEQRDNQDQTRKIAPLTCAKDAIKLDSSNLTIEQVAKKVISLARSKGL